jgi:hypothetical protein
MKALVERVLRSPCFEQQPPVLVDIGASGGLPRKWRWLAPHSVCVAFDADSRDFSEQPDDARGWRKLWLFNRLVTATSEPSVEFHLTASPHCSSSLRPNNAALQPWAFRSLFEVERCVSLPATTLPAALQRAGIMKVDWFKCDSQGTDLRLFRSLDGALQARVLAADFEPGIIDAYHGEDKLHQLMAYMDTLPFWVSNMTVKGSQRIDRPTWDGMNRIERRAARSFFRSAPGWCEITYLNNCDAADSERDLLLAWVFATVERQHGFGIELARRGQARFGNPLFSELLSASLARKRYGYLRLLPDVVRWLGRRFG